jgi:hypothetical protein
MAKMFYTLEEVAAKLKRSPDDVKAMAKSGQIQEFRDRDKLMFKVDQIDLLAGSDEETGDVHLELADSHAGSGLSGRSGGGSGLDMKEDSGIGLADSREGTGISIFDTGHGGEEHGGNGATRAASGDTAVGMETVDDELSLESVGSGSGLLDLTRESDDTSLGAELLEEVYSSDENIEIPANASGLFEAASGDAGVEARPGAMAMPMMVEVYDGAGSGLGAGLLIGALASMICVAIVAFVGLSGAYPQLADMFASNLWVWFGGLFGVTVVCGLVGLFLGKASE